MLIRAHTCKPQAPILLTSSAGGGQLKGTAHIIGCTILYQYMKISQWGVGHLHRITLDQGRGKGLAAGSSS